MKRLENLPQKTQDEIRNTLKAYNECNVTYEHGEYHTSPHIYLKAAYATDRKFIGTFYAEEVFTLEERTENYIKTFRDYPYWYKGPRDYAALNKRFANA